MKARVFLGLLLILNAAFCITASAADSEVNPKDPYEKFNRAMFEFNDAVDNAFLKPVGKGYRAVVPEPARNCIGNVFSNIGDVFVAANNLLQGKPADAVSDVCRVLINSTIGLFGCFDVASEMGLVKHNEDFGQTLGRWGLGSGPYLVLPFFGPSDVRDAFGLAVDVHVDPVANIDHIRTRNSLLGLRLIDRRASLLDATDLMEKVALDRYAYLRDAYLQRRRSLIYDGNPPEDRSSETSAATPTEAAPAPGTPPIGWFDAPTQREPLPVATSAVMESLAKASF
ncbi:MAG: VacJ family lipoprotein [Burkholderiaceae bacterium]|nr:MAG: VacJ family lipoprotein [Burkholderiaceae bacterium]